MRDLTFASPKWIDCAAEVLTDLAQQHPDTVFSMCEVFTGAPKEIANRKGQVAWHFRLNNGSARVGSGRIENADLKVQADYEAALPAARAIYPNDPKERAALMRQLTPRDSPRMQVEGNYAAAPAFFLLHLHNRLAERTE